MFKSDPAFPATFAQALRYLVDNGTMSTRGIEKRFDLPGGCMDKWLDAHNRGSHFLELETIEAIEAGRPAPAPKSEISPAEDPDEDLEIPDVAAADPEADPDQEPEEDLDPTPEPPTESMKTPPYLKLARKPQQRTVLKVVAHLNAIAAGEAKGSEGDYQDLLDTWFGTSEPTADVIKAFLENVDLAPKTKKKTGGASTRPAPTANGPTVALAGGTLALLQQLVAGWRAQQTALEAKIKAAEDLIALES